MIINGETLRIILPVYRKVLVDFWAFGTKKSLRWKWKKMKKTIPQKVTMLVPFYFINGRPKKNQISSGIR